MERTAERTAKKQGEMDAFHGRKEETPDASNAEGSSVSEDGAGGGTRTHTVSLPTDFESVTSANSITSAYIVFVKAHYITIITISQFDYYIIAEKYCQ